MTRALFTDRKRLGYLLGFYRQRRELGYSLLYGNLEAAGQRDQVQENVRKYSAVLGAIGILMLAAGILSSVGDFMTASDSSCFACLFDSLQNGGIGLAAGNKRGSYWAPLPCPAVCQLLAGTRHRHDWCRHCRRGHEIAGYIRDPKKLLSPQNAAAAVLAVILSRIPVGKGLSWLSNKLGPRARRWFDSLTDKFGPKTRDEPDGPHEQPRESTEA